MQVTCARNNHAKKNVYLIFETYFGILCVFARKSKYSCTINMYTCEKLPPSHELSYFGL